MPRPAMPKPEETANALQVHPLPSLFSAAARASSSTHSGWSPWITAQGPKTPAMTAKSSAAKMTRITATERTRTAAPLPRALRMRTDVRGSEFICLSMGWCASIDQDPRSAVHSTVLASASAGRHPMSDSPIATRVARRRYERSRGSMYAIIETGGKQYRVEVGTELEVESLDVELGKTLTIERVLLVADGDDA